MIPLGIVGGARVADATTGIITDTFNRANNATTMGYTNTGQAWQPQTGTVWGILNNAGYRVSPNAIHGTVTVPMGTENMRMTGKATSTYSVAYQGICARGNPATASDGYMLWRHGSAWALVRRVGGVQTSLVSTIPGAVDALLSIECVEEGVGTRVKVSIEGVVKYETLDVAAARPHGTGGGFFIYSTTGSGHSFTNFEAEAL